MALHAKLIPLAALLVAMVSVQTGAALVKGLFPRVGVAGATTLRLALASVMLLAVWRPWRRLPKARETRSLLIYGVAMGVHESLLLFGARPHTARHRGRARVHRSAGGRHGRLAPRDRFRLGRPRGARLGCVAADGARTRAVVAGGHRIRARGRRVLGAVHRVRPKGGRFARRHERRARHGDRCHRDRPSAWRRRARRSSIRRSLPSPAGSRCLSSALPYSLEMFALTRLPTRTFGVLMSVEPALGALSGWCFLQESLSLVQWAAVASIMLASAGSAATSRGGARPRRDAQLSRRAVPRDRESRRRRASSSVVRSFGCAWKLSGIRSLAPM